ncbi:MAG: ABC transporter substrate-binding protein [Oligoflexia bacterium]|nr:ABC transporter substrate-binding protein [Oligoflexia bacterium]
MKLFLLLIPFFCFAKTKLALNWKPEPEFGGFYAAQNEGIFKKYNLDIELIPGGAGQPIVQMVAAGKVEFGIASGDEVVIARARGADVVSIFAVYQTSPMGIMVHESTGIKQFSDIFNTRLTVALEKGLPFFKFLEKNYDFKNIKVVPYNGGISEFLRDKNFAQQVFITAEPLSAKRENAKPKSFLIADSGYNPYNVVLVVKKSFLENNQKLVEAMAKASYEGWSHYQKSPGKTNVLMNKLNPTMDLDTFNKGAKLQIPLIKVKGIKIGHQNKTRWAKLIQQLLDLKLIDKTIESQECFKNLH